MIKATKCTVFLDHYQFSKSQNHAHFLGYFAKNGRYHITSLGEGE